MSDEIPGIWRSALAAIPRGETRTFRELAALTGRPGAARFAGRIVRLLGQEAAAPWHRIVGAGGRLRETPDQAREQLRLLRAEGARPNDGEPVAAWLRRVRARWVAHLGKLVFTAADDPRAASWPALALEPLRDRANALARRLMPLDSGAPPPVASVLPPRGRGARAALATRLRRIDWPAAGRALEQRGLFVAPGLLAPAECFDLARRFDTERAFERTVEMAPRGFGVGVYRYFVDPPPEPLAALRAEIYRGLLPAARAFVSSLPDTLAAFHVQCQAADQRRGSCILLRYDEGGINHPHRDIYGPLWFPFQAVVLLSRRGADFAGGEFVLIDETAAGQRRQVVPVDQGDLVVFCSRDRWSPATGNRQRIPVRHGMQLVTRGTRLAAGVVVHLAR